jgi:membrane protein DedA with SNARE-associated domain/membrane-associated phospholipid phosphatase
MELMSPQSLLQWLIQWTSQYPAWTGVVIFATSMLESLVLVGMVVPGAAMMLGVGALIALGALDLWPSLAWAAAGAVAGDGISFWIGYRFRDHLRGIWPFSRFTSLIDRGEEFFQRHGGKSVVLGRFVGPVRAVIPTIAGMMAMPPRRFVVINVLSAIAWAPAYILPGVVFGASLKLASEVAVRLVVLILLLAALLLLTGWIVRRVFAFLQPRTAAMLAAFERWGRRHPRAGDVGAALIDPRHPESKALFVLAGLLLVAAVGFSAILAYVAGEPGAAGLDRTVYNLMRSLRTPWADSVMVSVTMLGDAFVYAAVTAAVAAWLLWKRNPPAAVHLLSAVAFGAILNRVLKLTLHVPRPTELYSGVSSFSFPSGHATMAMVTYGFLAVLVARELRPGRRRLAYVAAGLLIVSIATSRLYLGVHWFTDVAGGLALGLAWVALLGIAYRRHYAPAVPPAGLVLTVVLSLTLAAGVHLAGDHGDEVQRYALRQPVRNMTVADWWSEGWRTLEVLRDDLRGADQQPLNLQWAGELQTLRAHLQRHGWHSPVPATLGNSLQWLNPHPELAGLPLLPQVNDGRHEQLLLVHPGREPGRQWALRLWRSAIRIPGSGAAIWLGSVTEQRLTRTLRVFSYPQRVDAFDAPLAALVPALQGLHWRMTRRAADQIPAGINWDGRVVLATDVLGSGGNGLTGYPRPPTARAAVAGAPGDR